MNQSNRIGKNVGLTAVLAALLALAASASPCRAESAADVQKRLNEQTLSQGFSVREESELKAYLDEATKKGVVPKPYTGSHWRRGGTCEDLRAYSWTEYRDCMYYHRYYGRYYD